MFIRESFLKPLTLYPLLVITTKTKTKRIQKIATLKHVRQLVGKI